MPVGERFESEDAHVTGTPTMELGGFEPPTSWVRSTEGAEREVVRTYSFAALSDGLGEAAESEICRDMHRYAGSQALLAKSA